MESRKVFKSQKNDNVYHIESDRLVVSSASGDKEIPLPVDPTSYMNYLGFLYMFYEAEKLFVVVATRDPYDVRFELDEDKLELKGPPVPTY